MTQAYRVQVTVADRIKAGLALQMVAATTGVPVEVMTARARLSGAAGKARWLALYLAHVTYNWTLDHVGHAFGMNRTTVAAACRWAEDERDQPRLDALMDRLERNLRDVLEAPRCELSA
jgi:chromosomal replication initiation ATPase DnaA